MSYHSTVYRSLGPLYHLGSLFSLFVLDIGEISKIKKNTGKSRTIDEIQVIHVQCLNHYTISLHCTVPFSFYLRLTSGSS